MILLSESCKAIYPSLSKLQMLREIEELNSSKPDEYREILSSWKFQEYIRTSEFQYVEPILWQRSIMYKIKDSFKNNDVLKTALIDLYLEISEIAAHQRYFKDAHRALGTLCIKNILIFKIMMICQAFEAKFYFTGTLAKQEGLSTDIQNQSKYQEALLAWMTKDEGLARSLLRNLINRTSSNPRLHAESLQVFGNWMAETQSGNRQTILKNYYLESIKSFMKIHKPTLLDLRNLNNTKAALARFADVNYRQLKDYMQSPEFESMRKIAELSLDLQRPDLHSTDIGVRAAVFKNKKQSVNDAAVLEETEKETNYYLLLALE